MRFLVSAAVVFWSSLSAHAQMTPESALTTLISAFQNCGPPQAYQLLEPHLFQLVAQQTNGMGCYQQIAAAGHVTGVSRQQSMQLPDGMMYLIRVQHSSQVAVDWFVGINSFSGRVAFLSYQPASQRVDINRGPDPTDSTKIDTAPPPPASGEDGCDVYPAMCQ